MAVRERRKKRRKARRRRMIDHSYMPSVNFLNFKTAKNTYCAYPFSISNCIIFHVLK